MFIIGICIHLLFLFSIFDIYFKSPIVKNVISYQPQHDAVAERLVLFVVDGLRAESFVNYTTMPYLRSVANSFGRWGISNTRVPTESRPGHVAVIAGFYEDPAAIAKGWKDNPVDFDSVFNQTSYTWCWGSYDILGIFTKGSLGDHIFAQTYDLYNETFSTSQNTTLQDSWVFENVKRFFGNTKYDNKVNGRLHEKKIAFFLHLLGTDTSGHTHKPKSQNFLTTIRFVDEGIKEMERIVRDFYGDDGKTTFLMTSDHGMTDWGSHGAGDDHETQTPYVVWGAGVRRAGPGRLDPATRGMSLEHRLDVDQADLAPLMSTILSIPVPVNSVGQLRTDLLEMSLGDKAKAIYSNSRQLASQYDRKRLDVEANAIPLLYQPFEPLDETKYKKIINLTEKLLKDREYENLIVFSKEIMELSLLGLTYYHNYYQRPLLIAVTLTFIGWIICLLKVLSQHKMSNTKSEAFSVNNKSSIDGTKYVLSINAVFLVAFFVSSYIVYAQNLPVQYYLYFTMPILLWWYVLSSLHVWMCMYRELRRNKGVASVCIQVLCYTLGSLTMGLSFTYRWMLTFPLLGMGLWPFISSTRNHLSKPILLTWPAGCVLLSLFSFMPVVGKNVFIELVIAAGLIWIILIAIFAWKILLPLYYHNNENRRELIMTLIQMILLLLSLQNIYVQSKRFESGTPVSPVYQAMAWFIAVTEIDLSRIRKYVKENFSILSANCILWYSYNSVGIAQLTTLVSDWRVVAAPIENILALAGLNCDIKSQYEPEFITQVTSLILPLTFSRRMVCRLSAINTSLLNFYLLLSVSHEGLFMVTLISNVTCWILIEFRLLHLRNVKVIAFTFDKDNVGEASKGLTTSERSLSNEDFRRAFFFILYIILAFFGTGNIASLNSFEIRWVTCFITSFQPFVITGLVLLKTLTPFLCVACGFRTVQCLTKAPSGFLNIIVLIYSDIMGIQLLYYVKNTGSWLEIGTSISQFVIVQVITLFVVLISQLAKLLTDINVYSLANKVFESRKKHV